MKFEIVDASWFSFFWFLPETFAEYTWGNILFLYCIPLIPILFFVRWLIHVRLRKPLSLAFTPGQFHRDNKLLIRHLPKVFQALTIALVFVSLARPQITKTSYNSYAEGIDLLLVLDISESMELQDLKPDRLRASTEVAKKFIEKRPFDRIGLVVFSSNALSLSPLTHDRAALTQWLSEVNTNMMESSGTAIGNAVATGINRLRESDAKSKAIILISDGENTAGKIDPISAAMLASAFNVKVYSIAIGKEGRVPYRNNHTGELSYIESHLDETTLGNIAKITGGQFYRAGDSKKLENVFEQIDQLEKYTYKLSSSSETYDYYAPYLYWGILFFLIWLFTKNTFLSNAMED